MTYQEMCEYTASWLSEKTGKPVTADEVWNISPTGELAPVYDLYWAAKCDRENLRMVINRTPGPDYGDITFVPIEP